jgi:GNAT superfamily N-acetyltransferase
MLSGDIVEVRDIEIKQVRSWSSEEIVELYKVGGWWKEGYEPNGIPLLIEGSFVFVVAIEKSIGQAVGMGRAISDGVSDAWIQDVVVLDKWRGKGVGREIVKNLLDYCLDKNLTWIGLVAEPDSREFYTPLGFRELPGEPLIYQPED